MKKLILFIAFAPFIFGCSNSSSKNETEDENSAQIEETAKKADEIYDKATKLEQEADSLLNNI